MKYFIISDTHFGHDNIIKYCNRPFRNSAEMDEALIKNWNETVSNKDTVFLLGDFALASKERCQIIMNSLNGTKNLIMGNHDNYTENFYREIGFKTVSRFPIIWNKFFILSHAPMELSETTPYFNYYGHVHNDSKYVDNATSRCISVERTGYRPVLIYETNGG